MQANVQRNLTSSVVSVAVHVIKKRAVLLKYTKNQSEESSLQVHMQHYVVTQKRIILRMNFLRLTVQYFVVNQLTMGVLQFGEFYLDLDLFDSGSMIGDY